MPRSTSNTDQGGTAADPNADATAQAVAAASDPSVVAGADVDENGQVRPDGRQARGVVAPRRYSEGEGYEPGRAAPKTLFLDTDTDKVVSKEPERGVALTRKGEPVEPFAARALADRKYKG